MNNKILTDERIKTISPLPGHLLFGLMDGRVLAVPLDWYPRLRAASTDELSRWEIRGGGFVARWPDLDEDLEISGLLAGNPAPELRPTGEIAPGRIRDFRESSGISQYELAEQLGVRQATISDWEKGKTAPSPLAATRLRELVRKNELTNKHTSGPASQVNFLPGSTNAFAYAHEFGPQAERISTLWMASLDTESANENAGTAGVYRFTDLDVIFEAHERNSHLVCARFNPPRQFIHSCGSQSRK